MAITAALIVAAGAAIASGVSAAGSAQAGKASGKSAAAASERLSKMGSQTAAGLEGYKQALSDPEALALDAVKANMRNLPDIIKLGRETNQYNQWELTRMIGQIMPSYRKSMDIALRNTRAMVAGALPADVQMAIRNRGAERANAFGFGGSDSTAARALTARDLGLSSLALMQQGENSLMRWAQTARTYLMPAPFDPTTMFVTPEFEARTIQGAANIASKQADLILGAGTGAVAAQQAGDAAAIKGQQGMYQGIAQGIQGVSGAAGGYFASTGGAGMPVDGSTPRKVSAGTTPTGWQTGPQPGTYYLPSSGLGGYNTTGGYQNYLNSRV